MKSALVAFLLVAATGCKTNLWKEVSERGHTGASLEREHQLCLGVVVARAEPDPAAIGVPIERVLRESPADLAGLAPGDEIRSIDGRPVRDAHDLDAALHATVRTGDDVKDLTARPVEIVIGSCGEERILRCRLATWRDQLHLARERCQTHAKTYETTLSIPFLLDYSKMAIPPELYRDYFGLALAEPLLLYRDVDVMPLLGFFSLFRFERTSYRDGLRVQVFTWPLKYTSLDEDDGLRELLAPGEDRFSVL